jgi:replication-associated recombination protein RarA
MALSSRAFCEKKKTKVHAHDVLRNVSEVFLLFIKPGRGVTQVAQRLNEILSLDFVEPAGRILLVTDVRAKVVSPNHERQQFPVLLHVHSVRRFNRMALLIPFQKSEM